MTFSARALASLAVMACCSLLRAGPPASGPAWSADAPPPVATGVARMPYFVSEGSLSELGYAYGTAFRGQVDTGIKTWLAGSRGDGLKNDKRANSLRYLQEHEPQLWEEMRAMARGAGITPEKLFELNAWNAVPSCTGVIVADKQGRVVMGSTADIDDRQRAFSCVHRRTERGPQGEPREAVLLLWAGTFWVHAGMNSDGLAVCCTSAPRIDGQDGHGLPQHLVVYVLLTRCKDVPEAVAYLAGLRLAGKGLNLLLADRQGRVAAVEKSYNRQAVSQAERACLWRTNHFLSPEMAAYNRPGPTLDNSTSRFKRIEQELGQQLPDDAYTAVRALLATRGLGGLCQYKVGSFDTLAAAVLDPQAGWIEICGGKPDKDGFQRFELSRGSDRRSSESGHSEGNSSRATHER